MGPNCRVEANFSEIPAACQVRRKVVRDNMGHSDIDPTQNIYGKSWWDERVVAVNHAVAAVFDAPEKKSKKPKALRGVPFKVYRAAWEPKWEPSAQRENVSV